jgi:calcineurin-like phosphoesterase family protein
MKSMEFVTSDLHLDHKKAIPLNNRPFESLEEQRAVFLEQVKELPENAILYILGDMFTKSNTKCHEDNFIYCTLEMIHAVHPTITLVFVVGNHDKQLRTLYECFGQVHDMLYLRYKTHRIIMSHYPMMEWDRGQYGTMHFFGHCHGRMEHPGRALDVGWDAHQLKIQSIDTHVETLLKKPIYQPCHDKNNGKLSLTE